MFSAPTRITGVLQRGLSLIELMVALAIGSFILLGLVTIAASGSRNQNELAMLVGQVDNAKYALQTLRNDIQHAGFYGHYYELDDPPTPSSGTLPDPCVVAVASLDDALGLPVQGYNDASGDPLNCLDDEDHVDGTDILVVRRAGTPFVLDPDDSSKPYDFDDNEDNTSLAATLDDTRAYIQSNTTEFVIDTGNNIGSFNLYIGGESGAHASGDGERLSPIHPYTVHIYFLSPCNVQGGANCSAASDDGDPIPTLKRLVLTTDGTNVILDTEALAEGIEDFQVEYGLDTSLEDGSPDSYVRAGSAALDIQAEWVDVVTARVFMLARNRNQSSGYTDPKTYTLSTDGTVTSTPGGSYRRNLFTTTTMLTNVSQRRSTDVL